ncbi:MAG: hypothetical protein U1F08_07080 [Steroidobacteraceae bacterium]
MSTHADADWNAMIAAWRTPTDAGGLPDPHGIRRRVIAESRRMTVQMLVEYAFGLALVGFAAWRLATGPGLDDFVWGFALLWFTAMALQYASNARRNLWRPAGESTAAYLALALERLRRREAAVRYAWLLFSLETAFIVAWYPLSWFFWPGKFWPLVERTPWMFGALCLFAAVLAGWSMSTWKHIRLERASFGQAAHELKASP